MAGIVDHTKAEGERTGMGTRAHRRSSELEWPPESEASAPGTLRVGVARSMRLSVQLSRAVTAGRTPDSLPILVAGVGATVSVVAVLRRVLLVVAVDLRLDDALPVGDALVRVLRCDPDAAIPDEGPPPGEVRRVAGQVCRVLGEVVPAGAGAVQLRWQPQLGLGDTRVRCDPDGEAARQARLQHMRAVLSRQPGPRPHRDEEMVAGPTRGPRVPALGVHTAQLQLKGSS